MKQLGLNSVEEVDTHYDNLGWVRQNFWGEWVKINPQDFEANPKKTIIENFYTKTLNHYKKSLRNQ